MLCTGGGYVAPSDKEENKAWPAQILSLWACGSRQFSGDELLSGTRRGHNLHPCLCDACMVCIFQGDPKPFVTQPAYRMGSGGLHNDIDRQACIITVWLQALAMALDRGPLTQILSFVQFFTVYALPFTLQEETAGETNGCRCDYNVQTERGSGRATAWLWCKCRKQSIASLIKHHDSYHVLSR